MLGSYVPFLLVSFQPYEYAYQRELTADGNWPSERFCVKSSLNAIFQPGRSLFGAVSVGLGVGEGMGVGTGIGDGEATGTGIGDGEATGTGIGDGEATGTGIGDGEATGTGIGDGEATGGAGGGGEATGTGVGDGEATGTGVGDGEATGTGVGDGRSDRHRDSGDGSDTGEGVGVAVGTGVGLDDELDTLMVTEASRALAGSGLRPPLEPRSRLMAESRWPPAVAVFGTAIVAVNLESEPDRTDGMPEAEPSHWSCTHDRLGNPSPTMARDPPGGTEPEVLSMGVRLAAPADKYGTISAGSRRTIGNVANRSRTRR